MTRSPLRVSLLVLVALLALAFNLRPMATAVGPVMPNLRADLGLSGLTAGILTSLPTACFALFGALAPAMARRLGTHRVLVLALLALAVGGFGRALVSDAWSFLGLSLLALGGLAAGNVLAPTIVQHHFPGRIGLVTALYSLLLSMGVAMASTFTVPLAGAVGGWRHAYLLANLTALVALVPWLLVWRRQPDFHPGGGSRAISLREVARTPLGWAMALFFGLQSAQAYSIFGWMPSVYMAAGMSQDDAAWMMGIITGLGIPLAFLLPAHVGRHPRPIGTLVVIGTSGLVGYGGMIIAPMAAPWLWAIMMALAIASFPVVLALFGYKARSSAGVAALSGFSQSVGYLVALFGPFLMSALRDGTGTWTASLLLLLAANLGATTGGLVAISRPLIEDELGHERPTLRG